MRVDLPFQLGSVPIEWILAGLPVLALSMLLLALLGGGSAEKQTRRRIARIRASNAPTLTPQQMVSIRLSDNDSRSEEHTSELQSLMRTSYAVFCLKTKTNTAHIN